MSWELWAAYYYSGCFAVYVSVQDALKSHVESSVVVNASVSARVAVADRDRLQFSPLNCLYGCSKSKKRQDSDLISKY